MAGSVAVQERVENKGFFGAFRRGRRRIGSIIRIEHTRLACLLGLGIGGDGGGVGLRRCIRRQGEATFAPPAPERESGPAQGNNSPSPSPRAQLTSHELIPNARRTIP